jgi:hypothetical protein
MISEAEIQQVMRETGMDYLQAMRHLQQRAQLAQMRHTFSCLSIAQRHPALFARLAAGYRARSLNSPWQAASLPSAALMPSRRAK